MDRRAQPRDDDVVVTRESRSPINFFAIRQLPGGVQLNAASRDQAIRLARGFAMKFSVDVWYTEDGSVGLLETYRRNEDEPR